MKYQWLIACVVFAFTQSTWALSCKQSNNIAVSDMEEASETLIAQFSRIEQLQVFPQRLLTKAEAMEVERVNILACGTLLPTQGARAARANQEPDAATKTRGACQFDSDCARPMRCYSNRCTMSNVP